MDSGTKRIRFSARTRPVRYGDGKTFHQYRIVMWSGGKPVGVEDGPSRTHKTISVCRAAGMDRVKALRTHRLFIVPVTKRDIDDGEARSCQDCAIALWRNQERIGLDKHDFIFDVEPYGGLRQVDGIALRDLRRSLPWRVTGQEAMPDLVTEGKRGIYVESMYVWAIEWGYWADSRSMTAAEWREQRGDDSVKPRRPKPCSFVLNLSEMKPVSE
jgi:hypothetical protein